MTSDNCDHCGKNVNTPHDPSNVVVWCRDCFMDNKDMLWQLSWDCFDIGYFVNLYKDAQYINAVLKWTMNANVRMLQAIPPKNSGEQMTLTITAQPNPITEEKQEEALVVSAVCKKHYYGIGDCSCPRNEQ